MTAVGGTMRAVQVVDTVGPAGLRLGEVAVPTGGDDVVIDVSVAGVSFPDLLMSYGRYQRKPAVPFVPGVEVAGRVRIAPHESGFEPGQRVAAFVRTGGWAEQAVAPVEHVFPLPDDATFRAGAGLPMNYLTAHLSFTRRVRVQPDQVIVVHGAAGGLGVALVQVARACGARVIAVVSTPDKAVVARAAGAHEVVLADGWLEAVRDLTGGRGVDVVADPVGGARLLDSIRCLRPEGTLLVLGFADGEIAAIPSNRLLLKNVDVRGVAWGALIEDEPDYPARQWADVCRWLEDGIVKPVDGPQFALADAADALRVIEDRAATGKITVDIDGSRTQQHRVE